MTETCSYLISKILAWNLHINNMEVTQHPAFFFQFQDSREPVLNIALEDIFPVLQSFRKFREGCRKCGGALWIKITLKLLLVFSHEFNMFVHSICRETGSTNTRQLLLERLGNLSCSCSWVLVAAVEQSINNCQ